MCYYSGTAVNRGLSVSGVFFLIPEYKTLQLLLMTCALKDVLLNIPVATDKECHYNIISIEQVLGQGSS